LSGALRQGKLANVPVPPRIAATPGHYSMVGLLPEDHTFAKGSLFILAPRTKCVVFDVDGARPASVSPSCRTTMRQNAAQGNSHSWL
jgi:hypothetical protein